MKKQFKSSYKFSNLLEAIAAVKDDKGNVIVGQAATVPSTASTQNSTDEQAKSGVSGQPQDNSTTQNGNSTVTNNPTANQNNVHESEKVENQETEVIKEWKLPLDTSDNWVAMRVDGLLDFTDITHIAQDYNNMYNLAARLFLMHLQHELLARDIVDKINHLYPIPDYNVEANIKVLQTFILENAPKLFGGYIEGRFLTIVFTIKTTFNGWTVQAQFELEYTSSGELADTKVHSKIIKKPKLEKDYIKNMVATHDPVYKTTQPEPKEEKKKSKKK